MSPFPLRATVAALCVLLFAVRAAESHPRPSASFADETTLPQRDRVRDYDVLHTLLDLRFDWKARALEGTATHRVAPMRGGLAELHFDQHKMEFRSIRLATGEELTWRTLGDTLTVLLPRPYARGEELQVSIDYRVERPTEGIYWNLPDEHHPGRPRQLWSQGEEHESHFWFPCYDAPNERMTSEAFYTVEKGLTAIGNGALLETKQNGDGTVTFHYRLDVPHPPFLISVVLGEFEIYEQEWDGIPILSYVQPSLAKWSENSFRSTADMAAVLSERFGVRYPYPVYRQTCVENFLFGGMENIAATTLTNNTLHDDVAGEGYSSEGLVVHEIAHQWWGDLVAVGAWADIWLSEGFSTYAEALYYETAYGRDRMEWELWECLGAYLTSDATYRRPIVTPYYEDTSDLFDDVSYQKGSLVLHALRGVLGDSLFFETLGTFLETTKSRVADTEDFRKTAEAVTGIALDGFFDQWVYHGGHPEVAFSWSWDEASSLAHVEILQEQKATDLTPIFDFTTEIRLSGEGWERVFPVRCRRASEDYYFSVSSRPLLAEMDPHESVLKALRYNKSTSELVYQLRKATAVTSRARAAVALGGQGGAEGAAALAEALSDEKEFYGVRGEAALSLGKLGGDTARDALLRGLEIPTVRVRAKVAEALGGFSEDVVQDRLRKAILEDPSPHVVSAAIGAVARAGGLKAMDIVRLGLGRESWNDRVRLAALDGLSQLDDPEGLPLAERCMDPSYLLDARVHAMRSAAAIASDLEKNDARVKTFRKALEGHMKDDLLEVRRAAAGALGTLGHADAILALERAAAKDDHSTMKRAIRGAIQEILAEGAKEKGVESLDREIQKLRKENEEMKRDLERMRRKSEASDDKGTGAAGRSEEP